MSVRNILSKLQFLLRPKFRPVLWIVLAVIAWWTWMGISMGALALMNKGIFSPEAYASVKDALTIIFLVGLTVFYLWLVKESSWREGLVVGITAAVVTALLDALFYKRMLGEVDLGLLANNLPGYVALLLVPLLILGLLKRR